MADPDVLLLDEPTNHLDADCIQWLQGYLQRFRGALVLITHDRYVLDQVTNRIVEVDRGEARSYSGNYAYYLARKAEEDASEAASEAKLRNVLRRELEWLKRGPKARSTKQKARIQRIEAMQEQPKRQAKGQLSLATNQRRLGKRAIEADGLSVWATDAHQASGADTAAAGVQLRLQPGRSGGDHRPERFRQIHPARSDRRAAHGPGRQHRAGQHREAGLLRSAQPRRAREHRCSRPSAQGDRCGEGGRQHGGTWTGSTLSASQLLERFLFPPAQQHQPVSKLSGGERRRLHLCRLLIEAPNVLLLDEPTNDLDVQTLSVLEDFLEDFRGCVVVVSHDRYFLDRTVDRLFCFERSRLQRFEGNYSGYLERQQTRAARQAAAQPPPPPPAAEPPPAAAAPTKNRRRSFKENRELEKLDADLPRWEKQRGALEAQLLLAAAITPPWKPSRRTSELLERIAAARSAGWSSANWRVERLLRRRRS